MKMSEAEKNLRECQRQLDMDGVFVGVSRQALEEVLNELADLRLRVCDEPVRDILEAEAYRREAAWRASVNKMILDILKDESTGEK